MPKKGGGSKGGGKTEEEKLLFQQQRAQAEEEMARKREEILTLFLKDKLQKEQKNTAVNLLKLNEGWRSILRQTRAAELRRDITVLSQTFERQLDGLDSVVKNLERDLQEAERQSAHVRRVHLQQLERLRAQQDQRLAFVQQQWEDGLQQLGARFGLERKENSSHCRQQRADLADAKFTVEQQHKAVMNEIQRLYSEGIAAYESAHEDRKASLLLENKDTLREMLLQNQEAEQLCSVQTQQLSHLLCRTQDLVEKTDADMRKVKMLQDAVISLRETLTSSQMENSSVETRLSAARNQVNTKTHELRDQLSQAHAAARKQLTQLTVQSDNATKKLQALIAKGQKVLRVAEMCRKLENEQREVLSSLSWSEELQRAQTQTEEPVKMWELQQVTRSINGAVLQRAALRKRREDLSRENQQLRDLLRQHLEAMTVSGPDASRHHALLAVCQAPTTTVPPNADRRHTVIEAVHAVKHAL
ncbi:dynein regulatory complex subunit 2 isoform X2 [Sander lucioperca]|uniref:dynein regulatory complex subunit 2 isoform X2 n=1 Tax=Sander lucioperca TaxID=283035 RepID=UPI0016538BBB|nr:dynein regulatory complex subunit 2 isoform X2 [Sander lucioperca]